MLSYYIEVWHTEQKRKRKKCQSAEERKIDSPIILVLSTSQKHPSTLISL